jgi:hypothetical protein
MTASTLVLAVAVAFVVFALVAALIGAFLELTRPR